MSYPRSLIVALGTAVLFVAVGLVVFAPGLTGGFAFDDFPNIVLNDAVKIDAATPGALFDAAFSIRSGPLYRPVSMVSLALNHLVNGLHPYGYKLVNVMIHAAVALSVMALAHLVLAPPSRGRVMLSEPKARVAALVCGLVFLVHPFNLTPALYVVQRMTSLCALFSILSVCAYLKARAADLAGRGPRPVAAWFAASGVFALFGVLSKEAAAALALFLPITEATLLRFESRSPRLSQALRVGHTLAALAFFAALFVFSGLATGSWQEKYAVREFTLVERMLTEGRVILFYLGQTVLPRITEMGLYHDDFRISTGLFDPPSTALCWLIILAAIGAALAFSRRFPLAAFGVLWFFAGHLLESTIVPLELVHEHRNYLPSAGPIVALAGLAAGLMNTARARVAVIVAVAPVLVLSVATFSRAQTWSDPVTLALVEAEHNPRSARTVYRVAYAFHGLYLMNGDRSHYQRTLEWLNKAAETDPTSVAPYFELIRLVSIDGQRPDPQYLSELNARLEAHRLHPAEVDYLRRLVACVRDDVCQLEPNETLQIFLSALSNEALKDKHRAWILFALADFYVTVGGDVEAAARVLEEVVRLAPGDENNRINYARVLAMTGESEQALSLADDIEQRLARQRFPQPGGVTLDDVEALREDIIAYAAGEAVTN